jgi:hypothetical protein
MKAVVRKSGNVYLQAAHYQVSESSLYQIRLSKNSSIYPLIDV